jgi:NAD(P)-dependent dehydrogenase (short-subunit alcohol dehydrogenase family)
MAVIVFGETGSIGKFLAQKLRSEGKTVIGVSRNFVVDDIPEVEAAIWCQGVNINDKIGEINYEKYSEVVDGNLGYVVRTLDALVKARKLAPGSRCLVISSLWQEFTRDNKFSYTVSKAALGGLVRSCSVDLGARNIFINALLPGPVDNPMTRNNLDPEQISKLPGFVHLEDLWQLSRYLCLFNNSTNGQSIIVDLGFSVRKM